MTDDAAFAAAMAKAGPRLDRNAEQPAAPRRRHRPPRGAGEGGGRPRRRRQHAPDALPAAPARARLRPRHAFHHQGAERPWRPVRRRPPRGRSGAARKASPGGPTPPASTPPPTTAGRPCAASHPPAARRPRRKRAPLIAERLAAHPKVAQVFYPGLPAHPDHALAQRQQSGPGFMLSLRLAGGPEAVGPFLESRCLGLITAPP
jgi:hypothetical protein